MINAFPSSRTGIFKNNRPTWRSSAALTDQNGRVAFERDVKVVLIFDSVPPGEWLSCDLYLVEELAIVHIVLSDGHRCGTRKSVPFQRAEVCIA